MSAPATAPRGGSTTADARPLSALPNFFPQRSACGRRPPNPDGCVAEGKSTPPYGTSDWTRSSMLAGLESVDSAETEKIRPRVSRGES